MTLKGQCLQFNVMPLSDWSTLSYQWLIVLARWPGKFRRQSQAFSCSKNSQLLVDNLSKSVLHKCAVEWGWQLFKPTRWVSLMACTLTKCLVRKSQVMWIQALVAEQSITLIREYMVTGKAFWEGYDLLMIENNLETAVQVLWLYLLSKNVRIIDQ